MSWLNQSLNNLKGQITNFATEVLSEGVEQSDGDNTEVSDQKYKDLEAICRQQQFEIDSLKKLNEELEATLAAERNERRSALKDEDQNWNWQQPPQNWADDKTSEIEMLQKEIASLRQHLNNNMNDEEIQRLQEENKSLTASLEALDNQHQAAMDKLLILKKELQKNFEVLKQDYENLKSSNDDYIEDNRVYRAKINEKDEEIERLKSTAHDYETLLHKYQNLEKVYGLLRENAEKFQEDNQELNEENFKLQEQVTKLEHELEIATKHLETESIPKDKHDKILKELHELKHKKSEPLNLEEGNIDDNAKSVIEHLKRDIETLTYKLSHNLDQSINMEKLQELYTKYINFDIPEMSAADDNILIKIEDALKVLNQYKKEIDRLEHNLSEQKLNNSHLQTQIDDLMSENEYLASDMHNYEKELEEMKKNNDFLINEIAALKNTSKLEPIIETPEDNVVKLEVELADSNKQNMTFQSQIQKIKSELADVVAEKKILISSLEDLRDKYTLMLKEFDVCRSQSKTVDQMSENTLDQLHKAQTEIQSLKSKLLETMSKNEKISIDLSIAENEKVLLTKELHDLKGDNITDSFNIENSLLQNKLEEEWLQIHNLKKMNAQLTTQNRELQAKISTLEKSGEKPVMLQSVETKLIDLANEIQSLKIKEQDLNQVNQTITQNFDKAKKTIEDLKETEINHLAQIEDLKSEKSKLLEKKISLETQLAGTDKQISELASGLEKLGQSLQEKDSIIDALNVTLEQSKTKTAELNQTITDLENTLVIKNQAIESLQHNISNEANNTAKHNKDVEEEIAVLKQQIQERENLEKVISENKHILEIKDKEIEELNKTIIQLKEKNDLQNESSAIINESAKNLEKLNETIAEKEKYIEELEAKYNNASTEIEVFKEKTLQEKQELVNLVTTKHNESLQYHNEIQRLNAVVIEQAGELKKLVETPQMTQECPNCEILNTTLKEKDKIIVELNNNSTNIETMKEELFSSKEIISNLTEKCDNMEKALTIQLESVKNLTAENMQLSEQHSNSMKELERLRQHLVETEESYTQELMQAEQKLNESQSRLHQVEERAKQNNTVYTSNSIRANQEVETLRNQLKLFEKQREDYQLKLSAAEDAKSRSEAALTNLQLVIEQFQSEKERDIEAATVKLQIKLTDLQKENDDLRNAIAQLKAKLEESINGLKAASRLGDQLETKSAQISELKEQIHTLQISVAAAEERYHNSISNQQDKVDKNLVKNLVVNYVQTQGQNNTNRTQVLRILSTVLDFNQQECERLHLSRGTPQDSLAMEFVKFLEKESTPKQPSVVNASSTSERPVRNSTPISRKNSGLGPSPNPYADLGHKRNPSTGSNNLLFQNIDSTPSFDTASLHSERSSERSPITLTTVFDTGVNQTRNTEGAILKQILKDT